MMAKFDYEDGVEVRLGDRVRVWGKGRYRMATVAEVFQPGTEDAIAWSCEEDGGLLVSFDDGDLWTCSQFDEDFELVQRASRSEGEAGACAS